LRPVTFLNTRSKASPVSSAPYSRAALMKRFDFSGSSGLGFGLCGMSYWPRFFWGWRDVFLTPAISRKVRSNDFLSLSAASSWSSSIDRFDCVELSGGGLGLRGMDHQSKDRRNCRASSRRSRARARERSRASLNIRLCACCATSRSVGKPLPYHTTNGCARCARYRQRRARNGCCGGSQTPRDSDANVPRSHGNNSR
jgi:hypothetical protein